MKYTPMVRQAMKIAYEAHHGQVDKAGVPYIFHPIHLAEQMEEEISICVALLHDVIEDTNISEEKLREEGISSEVIYNIKLLTKSKEEEYMDYLERIKSSEIAVKVKLADLKHNSDASRLLDITEKDKKRLEKYTEAIKRLTH
ncbi:MAG: bifunctional (p)ppGpp synthetase/guanosine-3',5'-bis(diphosphate) 3'-pyrophosphohydrolase [Lachnospiraceae bacterium]|nr:bifunctional (p)ppGpp synthetase/guanosine-3',5'-bis(diphosphate) 3'-pyrophosphohydrolase [Lachnospiraceae bacterium]